MFTEATGWLSGRGRPNPTRRRKVEFQVPTYGSIMTFLGPGEKDGIAAIPARAVSSAKVVTSYAFRDSFTRHWKTGFELGRSSGGRRVLLAEELHLNNEEARPWCDGNDQEPVRGQSPHAGAPLLGHSELVPPKRNESLKKEEKLIYRSAC